jgi:hypothetical protein
VPALPALESAEVPAARSAEPAGTAFSHALNALGGSIDRGERLVSRALSGGAQLDAGQLIALQAGIYRYSEAIDLASKLVDRATSAVRTTLQSTN